MPPRRLLLRVNPHHHDPSSSSSSSFIILCHKPEVETAAGGYHVITRTKPKQTKLQSRFHKSKKERACTTSHSAPSISATGLKPSTSFLLFNNGLLLLLRLFNPSSRSCSCCSCCWRCRCSCWMISSGNTTLLDLGLLRSGMTISCCDGVGATNSSGGMRMLL